MPTDFVGNEHVPKTFLIAPIVVVHTLSRQTLGVFERINVKQSSYTIPVSHDRSDYIPRGCFIFGYSRSLMK